MSEEKVKDEIIILGDIPVSGKEEKDAFNLVEDIQTQRETKFIKAADVPEIFLGYQKNWHLDPAPVRAGKKSRRIGFSWGCLAAESVLEAMPAEGGMDQHYMGYNQGMAAEYVGDCAFFARAFDMAIRERDVWKTQLLINNERQDIIRYRVTLASGRKIEAHSSNPHNWRSRKGHARIDEAAFHKNLKEVLKGAMAFLMWGGRVDIVSTMNGEENDFTEICRNIEAGRLGYSLHKVAFKDALADGFYRRVCLITDKTYSKEGEERYEADIRSVYLSPEDAAEELDCVPKRGSGSFFSRMLIEKCQADGVPWLYIRKSNEFVLEPDRAKIIADWINEVLKPVIDSMPTNRRTVLGQDFGRSGDLSHVNVLQEESKTKWNTAFNLDMRNIPFDCQWQIIEFIGDNLPHFMHGKFDARGNGQNHAEKALQKWGPYRVEMVMFTAAWYATHFVPYKAAFEGGNITVGKSEDFISDHTLVVLHKGNAAISDQRIKGSDGMYRHADSAVAGVLAWAATQSEFREYAYITAHDQGAEHNPHHNDDPDHEDMERGRFGEGAW